MISGDLELFQDCTQDMHAADKRYVDQQDALVLGNVWDWRKMWIVGHEYLPPYGSAGTSAYGLPVGTCLIAPFQAAIGTKFDQVRIGHSTTATATARIVAYAMDETWLPISILQDWGTFVWPGGAGGWGVIPISFTTTTKIWGIGVLNEVGALNLLTKNLANGELWPPGMDLSIGFGSGAMYFYRIQSTGNPPGVAPPVASFSHFASIATTGPQVQPLVALRRSA